MPRPQNPGDDIGAFELQSQVTSAFTSMEVQSRTNLSFSASGTPFKSYILQVSQDFVSWDNLCTVTSPPNGILQCTAPMAYPRAFFRLRSQTP